MLLKLLITFLSSLTDAAVAVCIQYVQRMSPSSLRDCFATASWWLCKVLSKITSRCEKCNPSWRRVSLKLEMDHKHTDIRCLLRLSISWSGKESCMQAVVDDRCGLTSNMNIYFAPWASLELNIFLQTDEHTGQRMKNERERDKLWNINIRIMILERFMWVCLHQSKWGKQHRIHVFYMHGLLWI